MNDLERKVSAVRNRLRLFRMLDWCFWALLASLTAFAVTMAVLKLFPDEAPYLQIGAIVIGAALIATAVAALAKRVTMFEAAVKTDERLQLRERLSSALLLSQMNRNEGKAFHALEEDARQFALAIKPGKDFRYRMPRHARHTVWPAIAIVALAFIPQLGLIGNAPPPPKTTMGKKAVVEPEEVRKDNAERIRELAKKARDKEEMMAEVAQDLQLAAQLEKLSRDVSMGTRDSKEAVAEMSRMNEELKLREREISKKTQPFKQLQGLERAEETLDLKKALKDQDFEKAAQEMQKLAQQLQNKSAEDLQEMSDEMKQLGEQLAENPQMAEALKQAAESLQQMAQQKEQQENEAGSPDQSTPQQQQQQAQSQQGQSGQQEEAKQGESDSAGQQQQQQANQQGNSQGQQQSGESGQQQQQQQQAQESASASMQQAAQQMQEMQQMMQQAEAMSELQNSMSEAQSACMGGGESAGGGEKSGQASSSGQGNQPGQNPGNEGEPGGTGQGSQPSTTANSGQFSKGLNEQAGMGSGGPGTGEGGQVPIGNDRVNFDDVFIKGQKNEGEIIAVFETESTAPRGESNVSYSRIPQTYKQEAADSITDTDIPVGMRNAVKGYFEAINFGTDKEK